MIRQLFCCVLLCAAVDFCHQEDALSIAVLQGLSHANLTGALVVVPAVVHEVDAVIDGGADDAHGQFVVDVFEPEVPTAETDQETCTPVRPSVRMGICVECCDI